LVLASHRAPARIARSRGDHPDLPAADPAARLDDYVDAVLNAAGAASDVVVVGQSMGCLVAPIVADRLDADLLVLVDAMIPTPGESGGQWWEVTGQSAAATEAALTAGLDPASLDDPVVTFMHDVPDDVVSLLLQRPFEQESGPLIDPWPLAAWPKIPTCVIAARHDRLFPVEFMR
jgi:pimeloyl-ACP methyl ester carboxylesterase